MDWVGFIVIVQPQQLSYNRSDKSIAYSKRDDEMHRRWRLIRRCDFITSSSRKEKWCIRGDRVFLRSTVCVFCSVVLNFSHVHVHLKVVHIKFRSNVRFD